MGRIERGKWVEEQVSELLGKTLTAVKYDEENDELIFTVDDGSKYKLYHEQDCCEHVQLVDTAGELEDLVGSPLTMAEEIEGPSSRSEDYGDSETWTFYKFATVKGYVTLRWVGRSNGYYSERVNFTKVTNANSV